MTSRPPFVLNSSTMQALFDQAARLAKYPTTVLIEGESGVGKEVLANWIHQRSPRANMPFVKINCASIPESLLESELFGYERGAFTGAKREGNPGLFEQAHKGTLLLDEIGELSPSIQAKLLRVLQDREVRRVGGSWSRVIDVRILASTNRSLWGQVKQGRFREDLFYRLHVGYLFVPSLRERLEDVQPLIQHFMDQLCADLQIERTLSPAANAILTHYPYPGNVRELRNLLERLCVSTNQNLITETDLPPYVFTSHAAAPAPLGLKEQVEQFEQELITKTLATVHSVRQAAKDLKISHTTLLRKMQKHHVDPEAAGADLGDDEPQVTAQSPTQRESSS